MRAVAQGNRASDARTSSTEARFLIVDDDVCDAQRLTRELQVLGWSAAMESSPDAALAEIRSNPPEWACVEPLLPGTSWVRFLREVADACPKTRWLIVTAFPSSALAVEAMKRGAFDVLAKPVTGSELTSVCRGQAVHKAKETHSDLSLAALEWEHLNKVLRLCAGNVSEASRRLGIPRQTFYNKLRKIP